MFLFKCNLLKHNTMCGMQKDANYFEKNFYIYFLSKKLKGRIFIKKLKLRVLSIKLKVENIS